MENIDLYYQSLKQVLDDLEAWKPPKPKVTKKVLDWLLGISVGLFVLSLIPIIPALLILLRDTIPIIVGGLNTTSGSFSAFGWLWIITAVAFLLLMLPIIWIKDRFDKKSGSIARPTQTLSNDQIAFVKTYEAYKELKVYFVSHIDRHVENSYTAIRSQIGARPFFHTKSRELLFEEFDSYYLARLSDDRINEFLLPSYRWGYPFSSSITGRGSLRNQLSAAMSLLETFNKYEWFNLDPDTNLVLRALVSLPSKIIYRLRDQVELPQVLEVLENLSNFLYAFLPEHGADKEKDEIDELHDQGRLALSSFVSSIDKLTEYRGKEIDIPKPLNGKPTPKEAVIHLYTNFVFARFVFWFISILILTLLGVLIFNEFIPISSDTMASIVIGGSVAGATGLAVFLPRQSEKKH